MSISISGLKYIYSPKSPDRKTALDGIDLEIPDGQIAVIIGSTGSGKTTLIQHLNGLIRPQEGSVSVNGTDTRSKNLKELRLNVGMVFQYPEHQLFAETAYDDIAFGLKNMNFNDTEIREKIMKVCSVMGITEEMLASSPFELSGGQKRRIAMAGVTVMEPSVLVLDEPGAGLDPKGRKEILDMIRQLHKNYSITVVMVSHSMEEVAMIAQRVIVMNEGKIILDGSPREVFQNHEILTGIGLDIPEITAFMENLKQRGKIDCGIILTVEEAKEVLIRQMRIKEEGRHG